MRPYAKIIMIVISTTLLLAAHEKPVADLDSSPGVKEYKAKKNAGYFEGSFSIYIPEGYDGKTPMPLVISSHGAGGSGASEVNEWKQYADKYRFIVVCPSYKCAGVSTGSYTDAANSFNIETEMLGEILDRVFLSLKINEKYVMHTGFSGGGLPTWYCATNEYKRITCLCFRSANFCGESYKINNKNRWKGRHVYVFWGEQDDPNIITKGNLLCGDGPGTVYMLKKMKCDLKHEIIPGGKHESRADLAAKWFADEIIGKNSSKGSK